MKKISQTMILDETYMKDVYLGLMCGKPIGTMWLIILQTDNHLIMNNFYTIQPYFILNIQSRLTNQLINS